MVDERDARPELNLKARKDYTWGPAKLAHQGPAYLDGIKYIVTPEDSVRIGALLAGQADVIRQIQAYDEKQVEDAGLPDLRAFDARREQQRRLPSRQSARVRYHACGRRCSTPPTPEEIVSTLFSANYPQATSIIATTALGYVDHSAKLTYDPTTAKALLDEAGWTVGVERPAPEGRQGARAHRLRVAAAAAEQGDAPARVAQQWAQDRREAERARRRFRQPRSIDNLDPTKTPVSPAMVGRADPDVIKSQYYPTNRNVLLQKGGNSDKVQSFVDEKLNAPARGLASEPDRDKRLAIAGDVQAYVIDQAYAIPIFEEPQAFAAAPYVKGIALRGGRPAELLRRRGWRPSAEPRSSLAVSASLQAECHMSRYLIGRIGQAFIVLWAAFTVSFVLLQALPGDAILIKFQNPELGLSAGADRGDPGVLRRRRAALAAIPADASAISSPAISAIRSRPAFRSGRMLARPTCRRPCGWRRLAFLVAARRRHRPCGRSRPSRASRGCAAVIQSLPSLFISMPVFWLGIVLIQIFSFRLEADPGDQPGAVAGPRSCRSLTLAIPISAPLAQVLMRNIDDVLTEPFVAVARAKGASRRWVLWRHVRARTRCCRRSRSPASCSANCWPARSSPKRCSASTASAA